MDYLKNEFYELIKYNESIVDFLKNNLFDGLWYWDVENPEKEWMDDRFWETLGYDPDEMPQHPSSWQKIINKDDLKVIEKELEKHFNDPNYKFETYVRYTHKKGHIVHIRCYGKAIRNEDGKVIRMLGAHQSVTNEILLDNYKKIQEVLKNQNGKFKSMFNGIPEPLFLKEVILNEDGEILDLKILATNPAVFKYFSFKEDELINKSSIEYFGEKALYFINLLNKNKNLNKTLTFEKFFNDINTYFKISIFKIDETNLVFSFTDITNEKRKDLDHKFLFDNMTQGVVFLNSKLKISYSNPVVSKILGIDLNEKKNLSYSDLNLTLFNQDKSICRYEDCELVKSIKLGLDLKGYIIGTLNKKTDKTIWLKIDSVIKNNMNNKTTEIMLIIDDITELINERNKSNESLFKIKKYINSLTDIVYYKNEKNQFELINNSLATIFNEDNCDYKNKTIEELKYCINENLHDFLYKNDNLDSLVFETKQLLRDNFRVTLNEKQYNFDIIKIPILDDANKIKGLISIGRNIDKLIEIQKELKNQKELAVRSDKLKTEFLQNLSHEIRTPLHAILGFSKLLNKNLKPEKINMYSKIIQNGGNQLLTIIEEVLELASFESNTVSVQKSIINLNDFMHDIYIDYLEKANEKGLHLYINKNNISDNKTIITDKNKLKKILSNLIDNAIKFTTIGNIKIEYKISNSQLEVSITDTGIGIQKQYFSKIFEKFSQEESEISKKAGGLGVGLAIVKENINLLDGLITLDSKKHIGSTFKFVIPIEFDSNLAFNKGTETELKKIILVAEDDDLNY